MTIKERFLATLNFEIPDRPFRMETTGFWNETIERWHSEGLPAEVSDEMTAYMYSGFDLQLPLIMGVHIHPGFDPLFDEEIMEQDETYTIKRDISGSIIKEHRNHSSAIPTWLESPVKTPADWESIKWRLDPDTPGRLAEADILLGLEGTQDWPLVIYIPGLFGTHRHLLGFNNLMIAYRRQPEMLHDMARHWVTMWKKVITRIAEKRLPDMVSLWEDMCYKNGPIISPKTFDTFMTPYYKELVSFCRIEMGIPAVGVDTDGNCTAIIPNFVETGVNMMWPFEVRAGMDVLEVRRQWPNQFAIWGGIDKLELAKDRQAIEKEVMRVVPRMLEIGGYIPSLDHNVPPDVSFDNWNYYVGLVRGIGEDFCKAHNS
jgi:uroporphyrinogen decarboxylase